MYTPRHGHDDAHGDDRIHTPRHGRDDAHGDGRIHTPRHGHGDAHGGGRIRTPRHGHDDAQIILQSLHRARERDGLRLRSADPTVWK